MVQKIRNTTECGNCGAKLQYDRLDVKHGMNGWAYIVCPDCGKKCFIEDEDCDITITHKNILFPVHFSNWENASATLSDVARVGKDGEWVEMVRDKVKMALRDVTGKDGSAISVVYHGDTVIVAEKDGHYKSVIVAPKYFCWMGED